MPREVKWFVWCHIKMQLKPRTDQFLKSSEAQTPCLNSLCHHITAIPTQLESRFFQKLVDTDFASDLHLYVSLYILLLIIFPWYADLLQDSELYNHQSYPLVYTPSPVDFCHWLHGHITILWTQPSPAELQLLDSSGQAMGYYRLHILNPTVGFFLEQPYSAQGYSATPTS